MKEVTIKVSAQDSFSSVFQAYQSAISRAATDTDTLATKQAASKTAMDDMARGVTTFIAAYAGMRGLQLVGDIIDLGQQANIADQVFGKLVSTMGDYEDVMNRLRTVTGGVVDDKTLQQGANKFMQMGIASNPEELERLMEMAIKLGGSMGMNPEKAISDFSLMMANNSIMRLDQFGISAGEVRRRMAELKMEFEGIDRSEAFQMAVLEIGIEALNRLGTAADAASTPFSRLQTSVANLAQNFSQDFTTGLNSLIGIFEIATDNNPIQLAQKAQARSFADEYYEAINERFSNATGGETLGGLFGSMIGDENAIKDWLAEGIRGVQNDPNFAFGNWFTERGGTNTWLAEALYNSIASATTLRDRMIEINAQMDAERAHRDSMWQAYAQYLGAQQGGGVLSSLMGLGEGLPGLSQYMTEDQAGMIEQRFEAAKIYLEDLQALNEQELITDAQLQQAQDMTDRLGAMSDQAQAAADAFENLSLSQALGQSGGGMAGEITDMVLDQMRANGATDEQIKAMQQQMGLSSGRETDSSLALQNLIIPMLAGMSPGMAGTQAVNIQEFLRTAALQGMGQEQITAGLPFAGRYGSAWGSYDAKMMAMYGGSTGEGAAAEESLPAMETMRDTLSESAAYVEDMNEKLLALQSLDVKINVSLNDPNNVVGKLLTLSGGASLETAIKDNGGNVPGGRGSGTTAVPPRGGTSRANR